jgi:hypothetical protein
VPATFSGPKGSENVMFWLPKVLYALVAAVAFAMARLN